MEKRDEEPVQFRGELPLVLDLNGKEVSVSGYYVKDIQNYLTSAEFEDFNNFMRGQTIGIVNNKKLVYKHDFDRWKNGRS